ncbi:MAG TPA: hypothetical protein VMU34_27235 [Mycobacterium sp.]|nr:hypothetical protein [Mycobacterium sp.]
MSTTSEATELVIVDRHEGVLTIIINRPAQRNAINHEVTVQLASALDLLDTEPTLSAADAKQYGLVTELTASGAAVQGAHELAQSNAPLALAAVKQVLRETQGAR